MNKKILFTGIILLCCCCMINAQTPADTMHSKAIITGNEDNFNTKHSKTYLQLRLEAVNQLPDSMRHTPVFRYQPAKDSNRYFHERIIGNDTIITPTMRYYPPLKKE